jgi:hypothetical protein
MIVIPTDGLKTIVTHMTLAGGYLATALCDLFNNQLSPGPGNVYTDFTVADFDGYVGAVPITWGTVFIDSTGAATTVGNNCGFYCTGNSKPQIIYGYFVHALTTLQFSEAFAAPIAVNGPNDAVIAVPRFSFGQ